MYYLAVQGISFTRVPIDPVVVESSNQLVVEHKQIFRDWTKDDLASKLDEYVNMEPPHIVQYHRLVESRDMDLSDEDRIRIHVYEIEVLNNGRSLASLDPIARWMALLIDVRIGCMLRPNQHLLFRILKAGGFSSMFDLGIDNASPSFDVDNLIQLLVRDKSVVMTALN
eukprot:788952_1